MKCQECGNIATHRIISNGNHLCEKHSNDIRCYTWVVSIEYYNEIQLLYNKIYPQKTFLLSVYKIFKKIEKSF
jgi:hypothetical protein